MYLPDQMLRNLSPREVTPGEQRQTDEQRGQMAAALARWGHRVRIQVLRRVGPWEPAPARHPHPYSR